MTNQWHNCPNLAAFWYNTISAFLYFYTLYTSGTRYQLYRNEINDPRYGHDWNDNYLLLYLAAILLSSLLWLLFVFASLFKTGSLANDYVDINTYRGIIGLPHLTWSNSLICRKVLARLRYHLIPFNSTVHLCGAFFLIVPIPLMLEEKIKHEIVNSDHRSVNYLLYAYTPELINFVMAAVSVIVRMPTVFLGASTQIGIIFSCVLFISNSNILICSIFHQLLPLESVRYDIIDMATVDIVLFVLVVINYGLIYEMARTRFMDLAYSVSDHTSGPIKRPNTVRYWPNLLSTFLLITSIIFNIYQSRTLHSGIPLFFFYLLATMLHYLSWLITLLLFTFKIDWHFKSLLVPTKTNFFSQDPSLPIHNPDLKVSDTMYTCFQAHDGVRSVSMGSSRTPNHDFSPTSSSSGSHTSDRMASFKHIPSISKQLETMELNYDEAQSFRNVSRQGINILQEITEENSDQIGYFKSPNISQRSSNIHSSDSGIGTTPRDQQDYRLVCEMPSRGRPNNLPAHIVQEYEITEDRMGTINIYSDV